MIQCNYTVAGFKERENYFLKFSALTGDGDVAKSKHPLNMHISTMFVRKLINKLASLKDAMAIS